MKDYKYTTCQLIGRCCCQADESFEDRNVADQRAYPIRDVFDRYTCRLLKFWWRPTGSIATSLDLKLLTKMAADGFLGWIPIE
jgi:hypothetical protein